MKQCTNSRFYAILTPYDCKETYDFKAKCKIAFLPF